MPLCVGAWIEMLEQVRKGRRLDEQIRHMRQTLVMDPLCFVPRSRRAGAELDLRIAEYYSMLGQSPGEIHSQDLRAQELEITEARRKVEDEAKTALDTDREKLKAEPASRLDTAQLAVDLLSMGRSWMEHFNKWSESQELRLQSDREQTDARMTAVQSEIMSAIAALQERLDLWEDRMKSGQ